MNLLLGQASLSLLIFVCSPPAWPSPYPESALTCPWIFYWGVGGRPRPCGEEGPGPPCTAGAYTLDRAGCLQWRSTWPHQSLGAHPMCRSGCRIRPHPHPGVWWSVGHRRRHSEGPERCSSHWQLTVWCHWQPHSSPNQWRQRSPRWLKTQGPRGSGIPVQGSSLVAQGRLEGLCVGWQLNLGSRCGHWTYRAVQHLDDLWRRDEGMSSWKPCRH